MFYDFAYLPATQPVSGQLHVYEPSVFWHVCPVRHGLLKHSSTSSRERIGIIRSKNLDVITTLLSLYIWSRGHSH